MNEANGSGPVAASIHPIDEARLDAWLQQNVAGYAGPLVISRFAGGQSNPTFRLDTPDRSYALRRKPPGALLKGAHAVDREVRVMQALHVTGFPVPKVFGLCVDDAVIGSWFYVMELVEGRIFWDARLPEVPIGERGAIYAAMTRTLAQLHKYDPEALGLGDFGAPAGYFSRQIERWSRQYREDAAAGCDAAMDRLVTWLPQHVPESEDRAILHGDFRLDNVIFHPTEPRIIAVIDWELSTLGHPLADFAYHMMTYHMPPDIVAGLAGYDPVGLGLPDEDQQIADYCAQTGRDSIDHYRFYLAFAFFKLAAVFHGIRGRVLRGTAASENAAARGSAFPRLAAIGAAIAEGETAL